MRPPPTFRRPAAPAPDDPADSPAATGATRSRWWQPADRRPRRRAVPRRGRRRGVPPARRSRPAVAVPPAGGPLDAARRPGDTVRGARRRAGRGVRPRGGGTARAPGAAGGGLGGGDGLDLVAGAGRRLAAGRRGPADGARRVPDAVVAVRAPGPGGKDVHRAHPAARAAQLGRPDSRPSPRRGTHLRGAGPRRPGRSGRRRGPRHHGGHLGGGRRTADAAPARRCGTGPGRRAVPGPGAGRGVGGGVGGRLVRCGGRLGGRPARRRGHPDLPRGLGGRRAWQRPAPGRVGVRVVRDGAAGAPRGGGPAVCPLGASAAVRPGRRRRRGRRLHGGRVRLVAGVPVAACAVLPGLGRGAPLRLLVLR